MTATYETISERELIIEDLAFAHRQQYMNERAYENKLITTAMYEFAKEKLRKKIDNLSELCYTI
jgi:hypothetical protein